MTEKLLITLSDIQKYRSVSENIKTDRLNQYIREAQRHDLRPLLGDALYYDFIQNFDVAAYPQYTNYQTLLNGESYLYGGASILFDGLVAMMAYFTLARFIPGNQINITSFGSTVKKTNESDPVDAATMTKIVAEIRAIAILYATQLTQYLYINQAKFPLYPQLQSKNLNKSGAKFFDPDNSGERDSKMYPYNLR